MRAAVYLRQSIDQSGEGLAVSRQREDCLALCAERGWSPAEYVDNDTSATKGVRPAYQQMLTDIRAGQLQAVVAWDLDRLHRQPIELEEFITLADTHRLALATVGGDADLSTDGGRLFARIKGAVARSEVERKSARQKRSALQRAQMGKPWGPRAFGYADRSGNTLDESEAPLLRDAFEKVAAGHSLASIVKRWNADGVTTTKGNIWRSAQLRPVLMNARYAGLRSYNGEIVGKTDGPGVVPEELWRTVNAILADPSRRMGPERGRKYLLSGIALCGRCGQRMGSGTAQSNGKPVYVCKGCNGVSRQIAAVDGLVMGLLSVILSRPGAAELFSQSGDSDDMPELRAEADTLRARLDSVATEFADGEVTAQQLRTITERINGKLAEIEGRMIEATQFPVLSGVIAAEDVHGALTGLALDAQRGIVDQILSVTILPTGRTGRVFDPESVRIEPKM
ncbi:hypothetical protein CH247_11090 [Rhodococcus sp. 06-156-3b]|nr:recombinase family protein [Rhodococcus sp. 06-156-3b]OZD31703.1 hypothetical protein CH247_11090 [Rhodococcus sp. 06-156-3b]